MHLRAQAIARSRGACTVERAVAGRKSRRSWYLARPMSGAEDTTTADREGLAPTADPAAAAATPPLAKEEPGAARGSETTRPANGARRAWMEPESRSRRLLLALGIYAACFVVYALVAGPRLLTHSPYNHYALLADAWLHGRHDLATGPPSYAGGNDFARFEGKWFISFPPLPAILMLPLVWASGSPENFRDAQFIVWLAGIGPAALFLVLEKLRRTGRSERSEVEDIRLALLFGLGTMYFFTAVQGTVWFAAHVVGVGLSALFVLCALDAEHPALAGALLGCMFLTRPTTALTGVFFAFEALRVAYLRAAPGRALPTEGGVLDRLGAIVREADRAELVRLAAKFVAPLALALAFASWLNCARFHTLDPSAFGHEYLTVGWQARIKRWGLFSYHYLGRNLGVMLAGLPWRPAPGEHLPGNVPFLVGGHGLALWFTTPIYVWLLWPRRKTELFVTAGLAATGPLVMNLLYQNSGWFQFGYRFSNDYAVFLFVMLAVAHRRFSRGFWVAAVWSVAWALFGALTFPGWDEATGRGGAFYSHDPSAYFQPENP